MKDFRVLGKDDHRMDPDIVTGALTQAGIRPVCRMHTSRTDDLMDSSHFFLLVKY
jgi:hypothetical protein